MPYDNKLPAYFALPSCRLLYTHQVILPAHGIKFLAISLFHLSRLSLAAGYFLHERRIGVFKLTLTLLQLFKLCLQSTLEI